MNLVISRVVANLNTPLLWRAVQSWLLVIIGVMIAAGVLTYFSLSLLSPQYSAVTQIQLTADGADTTGPETVDMTRQVAVLQSASFLKNIAETLNLATHPEYVQIEGGDIDLLESVRKQLSIASDVSSGRIEIRFYSADPALASEAANAMANSLIVTLNEANSGMSGKLVQRAVTPLTADYPRKGPVSLFVMSIIGLCLLVYILVKESLAMNKGDLETKLDEKHHQVDIQNNIRSAQVRDISPALRLKGKPTQAFLGAYPWQPERSISGLTEQLHSMRSSGQCFRVVFAGEAGDETTFQKGIELARAFSSDRAVTLLVDSNDMETGVSHSLDLLEQPGLSELVEDPAILGSVIQNDPESAVHIVASGMHQLEELTEQQQANLKDVFDAWSAVYEVVIVCCSYESAVRFYDSLDGNIDAGIVVQASANRKSTQQEQLINAFNNLDIIYYQQNIGAAEGRNVVMLGATGAS